MATVESQWDPGRALLVTELKGPVDVEAVKAWRAGLQEQVDRIPDGTRFRLLLDLTGYEPAGLDAHKAMRTVVPDLLVAHGLRPAFLDLFPEAPEPAITAEREVVCVAFANVHQDETKMSRYEERSQCQPALLRLPIVGRGLAGYNLTFERDVVDGLDLLLDARCTFRTEPAGPGGSTSQRERLAP